MARKTESLIFRLTPQEKEDLGKLAEIEGVSVSKYIRSNIAKKVNLKSIKQKIKEKKSNLPACEDKKTENEIVQKTLD